MNEIKKYRRQLSYLTLIALLLTVSAIFVARFKNIDYNILLAILIGIIINIFLLYRIGKKIYKNSVTEIKTIKEKYKPENITIDQVINQEKETSEEQSQQNKNHFDSLIEQFAQCADAVELS
ncbi:MAG: hypothetical protein PHU27_07165, partial [Salinivirgaceae bacterium]|nr:hypothetical protein [Salinivirgaceae bacterium]